MSPTYTGFRADSVLVVSLTCSTSARRAWTVALRPGARAVWVPVLAGDAGGGVPFTACLMADLRRPASTREQLGSPLTRSRGYFRRWHADRARRSIADADWMERAHCRRRRVLRGSLAGRGPDRALLEVVMTDSVRGDPSSVSAGLHSHSSRGERSFTTTPAAAQWQYTGGAFVRTGGDARDGRAGPRRLQLEMPGTPTSRSGRWATRRTICSRGFLRQSLHRVRRVGASASRPWVSTGDRLNVTQRRHELGSDRARARDPARATRRLHLSSFARRTLHRRQHCVEAARWIGPALPPSPYEGTSSRSEGLSCSASGSSRAASGVARRVRDPRRAAG